jgi:predicted dehydrogenase
MVYLMGMPETLWYERAFNGAAMATFRFADGALGSLMLSNGQGFDEGMERTIIISDKGRHIVVENNIRVKYHKAVPAMGYGDNPNYFRGGPGEATCSWEPEFSLGQLYNKGLFLLGYYNEVNEFARAILDGRAPSKGTLEQAWQVTRVFEAFAEGPGREIRLQ